MTTHRIRSVEAIPVRLALRQPILMSGVELHHTDNLLVRVATDSGAVGWGEAVSAPSHGGESLERMAQAFRQRLAPDSIGQDPLRLTALTQELATTGDAGPSALGALDMALHDLAGQLLAVPVSVLLGGTRRASIAPLILTGAGTTDEVCRQVGQLFDAGYRFFKLKVGVGTLDDDVRTALAVRERCGPDVRLCVDANGGMSATAALAFQRAARSADLLFFEQPLSPSDTAMEWLAHESPLPIGWDESVTTVARIVEARGEGVAGVSLKTLKFGGLGGLLAAANVCEALGLEVNLSGKIAETGIATAALLQLASVLPSLRWGVSPSHTFLAQDVVPATPVFDQGHFQVPTRPGLGITVDEERVRRWRIG